LRTASGDHLARHSSRAEPFETRTQAVGAFDETRERRDGRHHPGPHGETCDDLIDLRRGVGSNDEREADGATDRSAGKDALLGR